MTNEANVDRNIKLFTYLSVLITSGIIVLSLFLPFAGYRFSDISEDFSLWKKGDGYFFLFIVITGLMFLLLGKKIAVIVSGLVILGLFFIEEADILPRVNGKVVELAELFLHREIGYFLLLIGTLGLIAAGIVGIVLDIKNQKRKSIN